MVDNNTLRKRESARRYYYAHIEECRERSRKYRKDHLEECRIRDRKYHYKDKEKRRIIRIRFIKKSPWVNHFYTARQRCSKNGVYFIKKRQFNMTKCDFKELWFRDQAYLLNNPSVDRIDNKIGYIKSNCRFIEMIENAKKGNK